MKQILIGVFIISGFGYYFNQAENESGLIIKNPSTNEEKEPKRFDQPDKAAQWLMELRQTPDSNKNPSQLNNQYKTEIESYELARKAGSNRSAGSDNAISKLKFENLGPSNFGGRIRGFVIKTDDSNQLLAGAVSGGVFKSVNQGQSWKAVSDFLPTLAIGSMITDPDDPNRIFIGTGEGFFNFDAARGAGMFVSEDFGESWTQLASTDNGDFYYVNRIARVPNSNILLAATRTGIFRSENLGQSWTEASQHETNGRGFVDLKLDPSNDNHILATHYGGDKLFLNVIAPNTVIGSYQGIQAGFGPDLNSNGTGNREIVMVNDGSGATNDACQTISTDLTGKIALAQRGSCNFTVKVKNAQNMGATAVVIFQNTDDAPFAMGGSDETITIPSIMISKEDGELLAAESSTITANIDYPSGNQLSQFVMQSNDQGESWTILDASNGLPETNIGRMELAFGQDGVTYIAVSNSDDATRGLWRSNGGNANFSKTNSNTQFIERQGWYDLAIAVKPDDSSTVFVGAIDQYASENSGATLFKSSTWTPSDIGNNGSFGISKYLHSDHHGYIFDPNNSSIHYIVGDGGISKTTDNGSTYTEINTGLSISQSYGIAVSPNGTQITSGTQDNGSQLYFGNSNSWLRWAGGDGGYSAWDQQNGNYIYGSRPNGSMIGSNNGGLSFTNLSLPDTDGARFIQPFALNQNNGNQLIVGTDNVFYSNNARSLSQATFQDVTGDLGSSVNAVSFSESVSNQIFAGTLAGEVYKVNNIGTQNNLTNISPTEDDNLDSLSGAITDIKTFNSNTLFVTRASYLSDRVIMSNDSGNSWESISGNLPDIPVFQITIDPRNPDILYIGTELGLWVTDLNDSSHEWNRYDYGLAYTRVIDLVWHEQDTLYVGTHGRGTYRATREVVDISINKFVTTNSNNDDDGILDNGESGLYMLNLQNNSGFDINNAELDIIISGLSSPDEFILDVTNIPALSSINIPINASLANDSSCLDEVNFDINLDYDGINQDVELSVVTAANQPITNSSFVDGAESNDTQMTTELLLGNSAWARVSSATSSGSRSWFTSDENNYSDKSLISPWLTLDSGGNNIDFSLRYSTEGNSAQYYDGVLLELREKGGSWIDIGNLSTVSYDGQLFTNNSAQGRFAWAGSRLTWRDSRVDLGESYIGKTIQFRFRMISDSNTGGSGFWVDDISVSNVIRKDKPSCDENVSTGGVVPFSGLWFDRSKNSHGFAIEPVGVNNLYFVIFYTYDDEGNPEWYSSLTTLEDGVLNTNFEANTLQKFIYDYDIDPAVSQAAIVDPSIVDGRLSIDFNSSDVADQAACQDGVSGRDPNVVAIAKWKINNQEAQWCIEPIISEANKAFPDMGGTWFSGFEDTGWGFSIAQAQNQFISINYYYDNSGNPRWSIGSAGGFELNKDFTLELNELDGYGRTSTPTTVKSTPSGSVRFNLVNALNNLSIDGKADVSFEYQGTEGGQWLRDDIPVTIFTQTH